MKTTNNSLLFLFGLSETHLKSVEGILLSPAAHESFQSLKTQAKNQDIDLKILSGFRSFEIQKAIWNAKAEGFKPVLDDNSCPKDRDQCSDEEWVFSILRWSAFPGLSRHHWGTDCDVYDHNYLKINPGYKIELVPSEYEKHGPFERLGTFLNENLESSDFFRPYQQDLGGVAPEPWHLSFKPEAQEFIETLNLENFLNFLESPHCQDIALLEVVKKNAEEIFHRFALKISQ